MSLLLTRELLVVAVIVLVVVAVMLLLSLTQSRRRLGADVRRDESPPGRGRRPGR